ncbi:NAD(P)/FAD-dependent oxidoreductase [Gordonia terrae]|uniref:Oxidoreductase n=2 Tax=Bacteria TaxID=2 RepID=A0AAD0K4G7_9ACTN|nr:FAD-dependent oxidoreductase [Gordonia terrae]ANY21856.1 oxidoreductase [Gordonia terrae]AWO82591.1 oxidoreductase [Gordonia terrae]VTR09177.1 FAD-dependent pyridine nucleotide-disulfide oxidoreductase [Clostridioides difficile]VTS22403.1 Rhodocoxin reductase [Gordonia terrae]
MTPDGGHRVVVLGGGIGGGRTCAALRSEGFDGHITLIGGEEHDPYDRPPLSKACLTESADPGLGLDFEELEVSVRRGVWATGLDRGAKIVATTGGDIGYDTLVLATGSAPVRLPGPGEQLTLRTREDAEKLAAVLRPGARMVIVGAGWIGAEVATAAKGFGCSVVCVEAGDGPHAGPFGAAVSQRMAEMWEGVDLRVRTGVAEVEDAGVRLIDGTLLTADAVVVGVGSRADVGWLAAAGLDVDRHGICVDSGRRTNDPSIYAIGDVASRWSDRLSARVHTGHWDEAAVGGAVAARSIMHCDRGTDDIPYFWSDQFGRKVQYVGQHRRGHRLIVRDHPTTDRWGAVWLDECDRVAAHLSVGFPRAMIHARSAIADGRRVDRRTLADLTAPLG